MSWIDRFIPSRKRKLRATIPQTADEAYHWVPATPPDPAKDADLPALPRFQSTAGDQIDVHELDRYAVIRSRLRRAYTPAQPVSDRRMFAGRTEVLAALIRAIEDQRLHSIIYGERGIGKTSLLRVLAQAAEEARYLVVYITCGAGSEFDETMRAVTAKIPLMFHRDFGPISPEGERGDNMASILGPDAITVSQAVDYLEKIEGTRVLVVLDEYDRARSDGFRRNVGELLKSLSDRAVRVQFLIAGVAANLTELVENVPSIQRNVFALQLPRMTGAEIRNIIENGERVTEMPFDEAATHAVVARCIGFPYLATMLSHRSALTALERRHERVDVEDVDSATRDAVDEFRSRILRHTQLQIEQEIRKGNLGALGVLGGAAQSAGDWFTLDDLATPFADVGAFGLAKTLVDELVTDHVLLEAREDGFGRAYRFTEPSVPPYLWLRASEGNAFKPNPQQAPGDPD